MGGLTTSLRGHTNTAPAREAFLSRFDDLVDPNRVLSPAERARRSEAARKAHMTRLALRSSLVRGKRKAGRVIQTPRPALEARRGPAERPTAA